MIVINARGPMSACLTVAESPNAPHPVMHSLEFWSPPITVY